VYNKSVNKTNTRITTQKIQLSLTIRAMLALVSRGFYINRTV